MKRLIQGRDARESEAAMSSLDEQAPDHLDLVADASLHDGVVNVADYNVPTLLQRDDDIRSCLNPLRLLQQKIDVVPHGRSRWLNSRVEVDAEIAILIRRDPFL
jgi:hypothetical protein